MEPRAMSRRTALVAGACALAAAVGIPTTAAAHAETGLTPANEELVRKSNTIEGRYKNGDLVCSPPFPPREVVY